MVGEGIVTERPNRQVLFDEQRSRPRRERATAREPEHQLIAAPPVEEPRFVRVRFEKSRPLRRGLCRRGHGRFVDVADDGPRHGRLAGGLVLGRREPVVGEDVDPQASRNERSDRPPTIARSANNPAPLSFWAACQSSMASGVSAGRPNVDSISARLSTVAEHTLRCGSRQEVEHGMWRHRRRATDRWERRC